ncbi:hypothetical protein C481_05900 [Natrialba asiatica DSM 12278]|uniref:Uncharacterized protein n=1 Tax=Natrialba asiatica (strain ATCC 700177 / DSM 12278 / JCM 9576 / FERM P-10747 / NBRC 102637 / 172P1) TaxID=29540 RepID=M0B097_NATA1|nr:hypothetical protein C481_05900 [Natrialba asiatica DSM 12278]
MWDEFVNSDGFCDAFIDAVLDGVRRRTYFEAHDAFEEDGVAALHGSYRTLILRRVRASEMV